MSSFNEFRSAVSEKWKMSQPIIGQDGPRVKNTNMVENVEYFLSSFLKFTSAVAEKSMMPIRGLDGHLCFQIVPKTQTWLWTLSTASCQVLLKFKTA